jgi:hypothetical protein
MRHPIVITKNREFWNINQTSIVYASRPRQAGIISLELIPEPWVYNVRIPPRTWVLATYPVYTDISTIYIRERVRYSQTIHLLVFQSSSRFYLKA